MVINAALDDRRNRTMTQTDVQGTGDYTTVEDGDEIVEGQPQVPRAKDRRARDMRCLRQLRQFPDVVLEARYENERDFDLIPEVPRFWRRAPDRSARQVPPVRPADLHQPAAAQRPDSRQLL